MNVISPSLSGLLSMVLQQVSDGVLIIAQRSGTIALTNPIVERMLGYGADELLGQPCTNVFADAAAQAAQTNALAGAWWTRETPCTGKLLIRTKRGTVLGVQARVSTIASDDETFRLCLLESTAVQQPSEQKANLNEVALQSIPSSASVGDVFNRQRAEDVARAAQQRFEAFMDNSYAVAFMKDAQGRYVYMNRRFAEKFSHQAGSWFGQTDEQLWPADLAAQFREHDAEVLTSTAPLQIRQSTPLPNGECLHWQVTKFRFCDEWGQYHIGGMALDITEKVNAEEKLRLAEEEVRQAQKMEAVGRLAGGVAHDFNNLLTIINGCSELLIEQLAQTHPGHALARDVQDAGRRAAALTRQLLAFSRRQVLQPKVLDLNAVLLHLDKILRRSLGPDIEIELQLATTLSNVLVDPAQLDQAIINLAVNARDAMPAGGRLTLQTRDVWLGEEFEPHEEDCLPGRYVRLVVADSGDGMDAETLTRIFEPFFTTKKSGHGTGLGLAMVYGFVRQSGGQVRVESTAGQGSRFVIDLPCVEEPLEPLEPHPEAASLAPGKETVLVVEDEEGVRAWTRHVLEMCGYRVLEASHGQQALEMADALIDILVTDVVMPKMSGRQVADALVERHPELKVLYVSGYTDDAIIRRGILPQTSAFLQKPFSAQALASKVRELLDPAEARR